MKARCRRFLFVGPSRRVNLVIGWEQRHKVKANDRRQLVTEQGKRLMERGGRTPPITNRCLRCCFHFRQEPRFLLSHDGNVLPRRKEKNESITAAWLSLPHEEKGVKQERRKIRPNWNWQIVNPGRGEFSPSCCGVMHITRRRRHLQERVQSV